MYATGVQHVRDRCQHVRLRRATCTPYVSTCTRQARNMYVTGVQHVRDRCATCTRQPCDMYATGVRHAYTTCTRQPCHIYATCIYNMHATGVQCTCSLQTVLILKHPDVGTTLQTTSPPLHPGIDVAQVEEIYIRIVLMSSLGSCGADISSGSGWNVSSWYYILPHFFPIVRRVDFPVSSKNRQQ